MFSVQANVSTANVMPEPKTWPPVPPTMTRSVLLITSPRASSAYFGYGRAARLTPAAPG